MMHPMADKRAGAEAGPYGMTEPWYVVGRGALCAPAGGHRPTPLIKGRCRAKRDRGDRGRPYGIIGIWRAATARRVVAQTSLSCPCGAIHLLAPYDISINPNFPSHFPIPG